ncbi:Glycosyltransferase family 92 protein RCOM_0530710 [Linum perenne]
MKDNRRRRDVVCSRFFWCTLFIVASCVFLTAFNFSSFRFPERLQPEIVPTWRTMEVVSADESHRKLDTSSKLSIRDAVILPDQVLLFLNYPRSSNSFSSSAATSARLLTRDDLDCVYSNSSTRMNHQPPYRVDGDIVRCPLDPRGSIVSSLSLKSYGGGVLLRSVPARTWGTLVYEAIIDRDNTTVVFVKGLNLRSNKLYDSSRFECVYGWDFRRPRLILRSQVITIAQEIVRCKTPLSLLSTKPFNGSVKVSIRVKGRGTLHSIARPRPVPEPDSESLGNTTKKPNQLCICTMIRNQAKFIREWVMYHGEMGVEKWFIYDNNSDDELESTIRSLSSVGFNITRHVWPWVKSQEAGFAHCAMRARPWCEWVGFIDVDEFLNVPSGHPLPEVLRNQTETAPYKVGEVRVPCHSFGPSGLTRAPSQGVIAGYTCRLLWPERHKSIVRPEALNSSLINVVHHFHLREGFGHVDVDRGWMVINHYKYQVWEVFKEKFYRRVATYVADWQDELNVGSKDRAPGLGTKAVEPSDWSSRFCEVNDTGLKNFVMERFSDPLTKILPWEDEAEKMKDEVVKRGGEFW